MTVVLVADTKRRGGVLISGGIDQCGAEEAAMDTDAAKLPASVAKTNNQLQRACVRNKMHGWDTKYKMLILSNVYIHKVQHSPLFQQRHFHFSGKCISQQYYRKHRKGRCVFAYLTVYMNLEFQLLT